MTQTQAVEIIFLVEDDSEGGYVARAIGESIFTQAEIWKNFEEWSKMQFNATLKRMSTLN